MTDFNIISQLNLYTMSDLHVIACVITIKQNSWTKLARHNIHARIQSQATVGPPAKRHLNGVSLTG